MEGEVLQDAEGHLRIKVVLDPVLQTSLQCIPNATDAQNRT